MSMHSRLFADGLDPTCIDVTAVGGGGGGNRAHVDTASTGGSAGFSPHGTVWDVMAGKPESMTDLQQFMDELDESPDVRAAATLRSMSRIRGEMERMPENSDLGDPVVLQLQDVVVLMRQMLSRLR